MTPPKAIPAPRLPAHDTPDEWPDGGIERSECYKGLNLVGQPFDHADGVSFAESRIQRASFSGLQLLRLSLDDVLVGDCDLSNTDWSQAGFRRVIVENCRLAGFKLNRARIQQTVFRDCQGKYMQFDEAAFKEVRFERCALIDVNFDGADLRGAVFIDCDLQGATFDKAKLERTDFRGANVESSRIKVEELRGAIIAPHQAVVLFERQTGVVIREGL